MITVIMALSMLFILGGCAIEDTTPPSANTESVIELGENSTKSDIEKEIMNSISDDVSVNEALEVVLIDTTCDINTEEVVKAGDCEVEVSITDEAGNTTNAVFLFNISSIDEKEQNNEDEVINNDYSQNEMITVDPCITNGNREENVVVDIGFDSSYANREYYAYTNEYAQVVYVEAEELILQDATEPMEGDNRYCSDEAKVPGTESSDLDEGHIIADSLGGVSNAYNITPQESTLNRSGEQADMEEELRSALEEGKSVTNFTATITYANTTTQTPSNYEYSYEIDGEVVTHEFENGVDESQEEETTIGDEPQFSSCNERAENGYTEAISEDDPKYEWYNDGDGDGIVCE